MNDTRRRRIRKMVSTLSSMTDSLKDLLEDEDEARYNTPEALQGLDRFTESEDASDLMSKAISSLEDAFDALDKIV